MKNVPIIRNIDFIGNYAKELDFRHDFFQVLGISQYNTVGDIFFFWFVCLFALRFVWLWQWFDLILCLKDITLVGMICLFLLLLFVKELFTKLKYRRDSIQRKKEREKWMTNGNQVQKSEPTEKKKNEIENGIWIDEMVLHIHASETVQMRRRILFYVHTKKNM